MLYNSNKKCCNFEIVLITGKQKNFLKSPLTCVVRFRLATGKLPSSFKKEMQKVTAATNRLKTNQNSTLCQKCNLSPNF